MGLITFRERKMEEKGRENGEYTRICVDSVERSRKRFARHVCVFKSDTVEPCWVCFINHFESSKLSFFSPLLLLCLDGSFSASYDLVIINSVCLNWHFTSPRGFVTFPPLRFKLLYFQNKCFIFMNTKCNCVKMQPELFSSQDLVSFLSKSTSRNLSSEGSPWKV